MIRSILRACRTPVVVALAATTVGAPVGLALATETTPTPPTAAYTLAHTRTDCGVDRFDEIETTTGARFTDLSWTAISCVLDGIGAPTWLLADMDDLSPGHGRHSWKTGTVNWHRDPDRRLVFTVNLIDPRERTRP